MARKDETNAKRQATYRLRRAEAAKNWEALVGVDSQLAALVLPTNDQQHAIELFERWLATTYPLTKS